jgi:hypothetical protein
LSQIPPFPLTGAGSLCGRGVEWRIAHGGRELLAGFNNTVEDPAPFQLVPQRDSVFEAIGPQHFRGIGQGRGFDVGTGEVPPELGMTQQWVDAARPHADVEDPHPGTSRDLSIRRGENIGETVQIVCPPGNRRAKKSLWEPPLLYPVLMTQERPIQQADRGRIREIDGRSPVGRLFQKCPQFRFARRKGSEIIPSLMAVPRMQCGLSQG